MRLPLDLDEIATRWSTTTDIDPIMREFREAVADAQHSYVEVRAPSSRYLDIVHCGDPAAENEAAQLDGYFLVTEQFRLTLNGELNIILGRKAAGRARYSYRRVTSCGPTGTTSLSTLRPRVFSSSNSKSSSLNSFRLAHAKSSSPPSGYIVWLEIAYKLLEKDERRTHVKPRLIEPYNRLKAAYSQRVDGSGDFAVRLSDLTGQNPWKIRGRPEDQFQRDSRFRQDAGDRLRLRNPCHA